MSCPGCGHDNRARARFCEACGAALRPVGAPVESARAPRDYTPHHLAERILSAGAALQGERKAVTVLFADVQGSMALAEQVDPEAWHAIMNQFFAILSAGVYRYEGTVNQYTGDGIMALFGAPLAHEDHAQRACYAALHLIGTLREYAHTLRRERGLQFSVRMGLNSGEVVVGAIGDDLRVDYTAQGHTVGLAARMEQLCEPGRVYLTEHTATLAAGYFDLEDLGLFTIKGARAALRVFALAGVGRLRTRFDMARARGLSHFIGRRDELARLEAALADVAAGRAAIGGIVAQAGVGKSRLCLEFSERCRARGAAVVETQALAHGAAVPYLPVLALFRRLLGVDERDPPDSARQKIAGSLLLLDDAFKASLPLLFDFLGAPDPGRGAVPADAEARLGLLIAACTALLRARGARQPAVLLIEDLHWLDPASDAFVRRLVAALAGAPVLPVLNFRPEYADDWLRGDHYRRVALQPLADADAGELLDALLGRDPSLGDLAGRLRARAAGNPFFVEELVQSLVQSGALAGDKGAYRLVRPVDTAAIPTSVQAVLAARIDRLTARDKDVLQTAAVIGKEFSAPVLRAVSGLSAAELDAALRDLGAAELVVERAVYPVAEYGFKHPLTQEVAYASQLGSRRAHLHAAAANALGTETGKVSAERAALIAYHWEKAGAAWEAAQWQRRTARALSGTDMREAMARLRRVLALLGEVEETPASVALALDTHDDLLRAGSLAGLPREEGEPLFAAARALAQRTGDRTMLVRLLSTFSEYLMMGGHSTDATALLSEATALVSEVDDDSVQLGVAIDRAQTNLWTGRLRPALVAVEDALQWVERGMQKETGIPIGLTGRAFVLALHGLCRALMGRPREGAAELDRVVELADAEGSIEGRCIARQFRSIAALTAGELGTAVAQGRAATQLAARAANPFLQLMAASSLGSACAYAGRAEEALQLLQSLADEAGGPSSLGIIGWYMLPGLAEAQRRTGDVEAACATAARAVELTRANGALTAECNAQLVAALSLSVAHGAAARPAVEAALARAAALIEESGAESFRPRWHLARAEWSRQLGEADAVRHELQAALRLCTEMGMDESADEIIRELAGVEATGRD